MRSEFLPQNIIELYKDPDCIYYSVDKTGFSEKFYGVIPEKNDFIVTKNSYDAFTNPELKVLLNKLGVKVLAITGVFGEGCVQATIQGGFSNGYNFIILKDLIETADTKIRQKLQKILKENTWPIMFGKTINSKDFFDLVE